MDNTDLAVLLADPRRAEDIPRDHIPATLARLAAMQSQAAALQGVLATRLLDEPTHSSNGDEERLVSIDEAAKILGKGKDWVYRHAPGLKSFAVKVGGEWRFHVGRMREWLRNGGRS